MTPEEKIQTLVSAIVSGWRTRWAIIASWKRQIALIDALLAKENEAGGLCPDCGDAGECSTCFGKTENQ